MKKTIMLRTTAIGAFALLLAACSSQELVPVETPPEPTTSPAQAEERLAGVARERAAIESRFTNREVDCYDKFFVNRCLDEAREVRRAALVTQNAIEIEAAHYLRRLKVEERDKAIAEADAAYAAEEAAMAANPPPVKTAADAAVPPPRKPGTARSSQRAQESQARAEKTAEERAANVAAYEERRRKSEERQKEVVRRVAEREAKAAERAAAEAKKAAGQPAPATN